MGFVYMRCVFFQDIFTAEELLGGYGRIVCKFLSMIRDGFLAIDLLSIFFDMFFIYAVNLIFDMGFFLGKKIILDDGLWC